MKCLFHRLGCRLMKCLVHRLGYRLMKCLIPLPWTWVSSYEMFASMDLGIVS
jgi:hypothetical protein